MSQFNGNQTALLGRLRPKALDRIAVGANKGDLTPRENEYDFWWNEIKRARSKLDREYAEDRWFEYRQAQAYEGSYNDWNFTSPPINDRVEEITGERPDISIEVRHKSQQEVVSQVEALILDAAERPGQWPAVKRIVADSAWLGIGWGKQEWQSGRLPTTPGVQEMNAAAEQQQMLEIAAEEMMMQMTGQALNIQPTDLHWLHIERHHRAMRVAPHLEARLALQAHIELHEAQPDADDRSESRLVRIRPEDMIYDPDAREYAKTLWVAERSNEVLEDVLANPDYKNATREDDFAVRHEHLDAEPDAEGDEGDLSVDDEDLDGSPTLRVVEVYRIHDRRGGKVWNDPGYDGPRLIILSPQQVDKKPLNVVPWPYRGSIYRPVVLSPVADRIEGVSMVRVIRHADTKLRTVNDSRVDAVEKAPKDRGLISASAFSTEAEWKSFLNGGDDWSRLKGQFDPSQVFQIKPQQINPDLYAVEPALQGYINRSLRSAEVSQGVEGGAKFATEIEALVAARGRGVREFQETVAAWLAEMTRLMLWQLHDFATTEQVLSASGGLNLNRNILEPEEIPLDPIIRVDLDSFSAVNKELNKKQLREFLQFLFVETQGMLLAVLTPEALTEILVKALRLNGFKEPEKMIVTLDAGGQSMLLQQMAAGGAMGAAGQPGPNPAEAPPLQQPGMQTSGAMAADARQV